MKKISGILIALTIVTFLGGFLRLYKIVENPPSLTGDEISFGYSAYSILKTGKDEYGNFMPLAFKSVGDYKNPFPVYLLVLPIKFLGLSDLTVRLPNALIGILAIPIFFLFLKDILKDKKIALLGSFLLSISAWHIFYSRFAYEPLMASTFVMLGIWFFIKMLNGRYFWGIFSAIFLILTMYTAFAPRLFVPVFIFSTLVFNFSNFKKNPGKFLVFILSCVILSLPLAYSSIFGEAGTRFSMVFLGGDIEFSRYILLKNFQSLGDIPLLVLFWLKRYLNYLQPDFIFFSGLNMTHPGTIGLGMLYLFELPWLLLGIAQLIKLKIQNKQIIIIWLLTGILPDSLTNNQQHTGRLLHMVPVVLLITTLGAVEFFKWIKRLHHTNTRIFISAFFIIFTFLISTHAILTFAVHFPIARGQFFDEGIREAVIYVRNNQTNYKEIVIDARRGTDGPFIVINPHMSLLFYLKYDPHTYQTEPRIFGTPDKPFYNFNKYTIRNIDWTEDRSQKGVLFIGAPWSFPESSLKEGELLKKIYMTSGDPAYFIVSPR